MEIVLANTELMLKRRGYTDLERSKLTFDKPTNVSYKIVGKNGNLSIVAFTIERSKVTIDIVKTVISLTPIKDIVLIHEMALTPDANNAVKINKIFRFETFTFATMMFDPISIVPYHYKIEERPKEWTKLPIILSTDTVAKYYNFKRGDIIAIEEDEAVLAYRRCV